MLEGTEYVLNPPALITAFAIIDIALDVGILAMPLPVIKRLNLSRTKRTAVIGVFLLGAFCLVCSIVRLYYVRELFGFTGFDMKRQVAITEKNNLWAHIEAHASTFTACLPTLRPLFQDSRSVHSLIGSVRTLLSIHTPSSTKAASEKSAGGSSSSANSNSSKEKLEQEHDDWQRLHAKGATTDIEAVPFERRSEQGSIGSEAILVRTDFGARES